MAKFAFQLEGVLRHRGRVQRERQRAVAEVQRRLRALEEELKTLDRANQVALDELRSSHLVGKVDLNFLAAHRRFTAATGRKAISLAQRIAAVQKELEGARKGLSEAAVAKKVIEKLRERRLDEWNKARARHEAAEMDEIGAQLAYRHDLATQGGDQ
jgi:flagellar FliJ protein